MEKLNLYVGLNIMICSQEVSVSNVNLISGQWIITMGLAKTMKITANNLPYTVYRFEPNINDYITQS